MRRQPNALNLGKCARDVAVKRRRHNGNPPHEPRMVFWALMASGQITMRKVDGWQSLVERPVDQIIDLAA
jgi:hypothetical protein